MIHRMFSLWRRLVGGRPRTSPSGEGSGEERRVWVRYQSVARTTIQPRNNGSDTRLSCRVRNVSHGGLNLIVSRLFTPGDLISVEIPCTRPEETETVLACIIHVNPLSDGYFSLGCAFSQRIDDDDLESFVCKRERPTNSEKREQARQHCNVRVTYQTVSDPDKQSFKANVINISSGGIGLQVFQPIEAGTLLNLVLESPGGQARTLLACVVHVLSRNKNESILGCNFITEMSEGDFESLLSA